MLRSNDKRKEIIDWVKWHFGFKYDSLLNIPYKTVVIDLQHAFLKVSDVLVDLLLDELFASDEFLDQTEFNPNIHRNLAALSNLIADKCHFKPLSTGLKEEDIRNYLFCF